MGLGVGGIGKLRGDKASRDLFRQCFGFCDGAGHALGTGSQYQFRAKGLHQQAALDAHGVRHDDDGLVAPGGGNGAKSDAGISAGGLDDGGAGLQITGGLRVINHHFCHPILGGTGGVEGFQLGKDFCLQIICFFQIGQLKKRRVADQLINGSVDSGHNKRSFAHNILLPTIMVGNYFIPYITYHVKGY